jgi:hypothetical protein
MCVVSVEKRGRLEKGITGRKKRIERRERDKNSEETKKEDRKVE